MTREEAEAALDSGRLWIKAGWYANAIRCRRNGKTRTWKTRHKEWLIPIKFGYRGYGRIDHSNNDLFEIR